MLLLLRVHRLYRVRRLFKQDLTSTDLEVLLLESNITALDLKLGRIIWHQHEQISESMVILLLHQELMLILGHFEVISKIQQDMVGLGKVEALLLLHQPLWQNYHLTLVILELWDLCMLQVSTTHQIEDLRLV